MLGANIEVLVKGTGISEPQKPGDVGYDLRCAEAFTLRKKDVYVVHCDVYVAMPEGVWAEVKGRSGLAMKGIFCHVGTIDTGYRGMVSPVLFNFSDDEYTFGRGDRVAQLVFHSTLSPDLIKIDELPESQRGESRFGSTGLK